MKEKETQGKTSTWIDATRACARAEDLVAYLYGEADEAQRLDFLAHTEHCASCRTELADFKQVRHSIGEWRAQALGSLADTAAAVNPPVMIEPARPAFERQRSAMAAIREFFSLSPTWMRAATAALAVVFCALIFLSITHYSEQPWMVTVEKAVTVKPSEAELDEMVDARLKQRDETASTLATANKGNQSGPAITTGSGAEDKLHAKVNRGLRQVGARRPSLVNNRTPGLKISPRESREIARDLRLIASREEDDLPRLSDLIDESN